MIVVVHAHKGEIRSVTCNADRYILERMTARDHEQLANVIVDTVMKHPEILERTWRA